MTSEENNKGRNVRIPRVGDRKIPVRISLSQAASKGRKKSRNNQDELEKMIRDRATKLFDEMDLVGHVQDFFSGSNDVHTNLIRVAFPEEVIQEIRENSGYYCLDNEEEKFHAELADPGTPAHQMAIPYEWIIENLKEMVEKDGFKLAESEDYDQETPMLVHYHLTGSPYGRAPCDVCGKTLEQIDDLPYPASDFCHIVVIIPHTRTTESADLAGLFG